MKIVHCLGQSKINVIQVDPLVPQQGEVLIKTVVSALCGSELKVYRNAGEPQGNMGHEAAGIVAQVGSGVQRLKVGDRVGCSAIVGCGHCDQCREGRYTWCQAFRFFGNMHAQYFCIPEAGCHRLPDDVPWDVAVLITGDALGVPYHASTKFDDLPGDITVAIWGLGPIGLGHVLLQKHLGRRVIGIDRSPERLEIARKLGAVTIIAGNDTSDVPERVRQLTDGKGADVCVEAAGVPVTAQQCFDSVCTAGRVIFCGEIPKIELSPSNDFIRRDITAIGSWFYHFCEYPDMLELYRKGLPIASMITHCFTIESADEAYRAMAEGKSGKVLLKYVEK